MNKKQKEYLTKLIKAQELSLSNKRYLMKLRRKRRLNPYYRKIYSLNEKMFLKILSKRYKAREQRKTRKLMLKNILINRRRNKLFLKKRRLIRRVLKTNHKRANQSSATYFFVRNRKNLRRYFRKIKYNPSIYRRQIEYKLRRHYEKTALPLTEKRMNYKRSLRNWRPLPKINKRKSGMIKLCISHSAHNLFITINKSHFEEETKKKDKPLWKISSGSTDYRGRKKSTQHAKFYVMRSAGFRLGGIRTDFYLQIKYNGKIFRWMAKRHIFRLLVEHNSFYLVNIIHNYTRSHGTKKFKKPRRV